MQLTRRALLLGGTVAASATVAACGSNNPLASNSPGATTLAQWYHEYGEAGVQDAVKRYAAEYHDATIEVKWTPGDYGSVLASQLLTDDVPDMFEVEQGGSLDMIRSGQLADLTELIGDAAVQFNPAVMKRFTFDGKIYGIPQTIDTQVLYYRPSVLKAAGVQPPTTFDDLVKAAKAVKTSDMGGFFAGNDSGTGVLGTLLIWASGHDQLTEDRTKLAFLTENFYAALRGYRDFVGSGAVLRAASAEWYDSAPFANGETAMAWGGLWSLTEIKDALGDDIGVLPFPAIGAAGRPAVPFGAFGACVAAKGKQVEAAKKFVKWLWIDQEDKQVDFSNSYGTHIPAKPSLVPKASKVASGPGAKAAEFVEEHGFANDIMWSGALGDAFSASVSNVIKNGADPASEFGRFKTTAEAELAKQRG